MLKLLFQAAVGILVITSIAQADCTQEAEDKARQFFMSQYSPYEEQLFTVVTPVVGTKDGVYAYDSSNGAGDIQHIRIVVLDIDQGTCVLSTQLM